MSQQILQPQIKRSRDYARQYEYMVVSVGPKDSMREVRKLLTDYAEYGKWELERTRLYMGGVSKFWLRRRVLRVERTA